MVKVGVVEMANCDGDGSDDDCGDEDDDVTVHGVCLS